MVSWPQSLQYQNIYERKRDQIFRIKRFIISLSTSRLEMTEFELPVSMNHTYGPPPHTHTQLPWQQPARKLSFPLQ